MAARETGRRQDSKAERLKEVLKEFGIRSTKDLDEALCKALDGLTIGIMTDTPINNST